MTSHSENPPVRFSNLKPQRADVDPKPRPAHHEPGGVTPIPRNAPPIPTFIRREPPPMPLPERGPDPLESDAIRGGEAIVHIIEERNKLRHQVAVMEREVFKLEAQVDEQSRTIAFLSADRDRLFRFNAEITVQFTNIQNIIREAHDRARDAMGTRNIAPMTAEDEDGLRKLATSLAPKKPGTS